MLAKDINDKISVLIIGNCDAVSDFFMELNKELDRNFISPNDSLKQIVNNHYEIEHGNYYFIITGAYEYKDACDKALFAHAIIHLEPENQDCDFSALTYASEESHLCLILRSEDRVLLATDHLTSVGNYIGQMNKTIFDDAFIKYNLLCEGHQDKESPLSYFPKETLREIGYTFFQIQKECEKPVFLIPFEDPDTYSEDDEEQVKSGCLSKCSIS